MLIPNFSALNGSTKKISIPISTTEADLFSTDCGWFRFMTGISEYNHRNGLYVVRESLSVQCIKLSLKGTDCHCASDIYLPTKYLIWANKGLVGLNNIKEG